MTLSLGLRNNLWVLFVSYQAEIANNPTKSGEKFQYTFKLRLSKGIRDQKNLVCILTKKLFLSDFRIDVIAFLFSNFSAGSAQSVTEFIPGSPFIEHKGMRDG